MASRQKVQKQLGEAVKAVRSAAGKTQEEVARSSGLHPTYISDIERGVRNPSWEAITRLAAGIGVGVAEIAVEYDRRRG